LFRLTASGVPPPGAVFFFAFCYDLFYQKPLSYLVFI
jgi:hypothetical protein